MEQHNAVIGNPEFGHHPKERRDKMVEKIKHHEKLLQVIRRRIEAIPRHADPAEANAVLDEIWDRTKNEIGGTAIAEWQELVRLKSEHEALVDRFDEVSIDEEEYLSGNVDPERERIADEAADRMLESHDKISAIQRKADIILLDQLDGMLRMLRAKALAVQGMRSDRKKTIAALNARLKTFGKSGDDGESRGTSVKPKEIEWIEYSPFEVTFGLSDSAFVRLNGAADKDAQGWHLGDSPFSLVSVHSSDVSITTRHESVHNLLDKIPFGQTRFMLDQLKRIADYRPSDNEVMDQKYKDRLHRISVTDCLDNLKEEMLAGLENAEIQDFGVMSQGNIKLTDEQRGRRATIPFSTAGATIRRFLDDAVQIAGESKDPDIRVFLDDFMRRLKLRFLEIATCLDTSFGVAKRLAEHERAHDAVINLCVMLRPSQYPNLPKLQAEMFGEQECREAEESLRFSRLVGSDDWTRLLETPIPKKFHPEDRKLILRYFQENEPYDLAGRIIIFNDVEQVQDYRRIIARFDEIESLVGACPETAMLKGRIAYKFFDELFQNGLLNGFKPAIEAYPLLDENEKDELNHAMDIYIDGGFLLEDLKENFDAKGIEDWAAKLDWGFFEKIHYSDRLKKIVAEAIADLKDSEAEQKPLELEISPFSKKHTPEQEMAFLEAIFGSGMTKKKPKKKS